MNNEANGKNKSQDARPDRRSKMILKGRLRANFEARLDKMDEDMLELFKRCDLLLACETQSQETMNAITEALDRVTKKQNAMAETLKQMTH